MKMVNTIVMTRIILLRNMRVLITIPFQHKKELSVHVDGLMKIIAKACKARDLKPGDLFSIAPQEHWDNKRDYVIGEKVYIRTEWPCPEEQADDDIFLIQIIK